MFNIVMIDNYDSFTFNLHHLLVRFPVSIKVYRNDETDSEKVLKIAPDLVVISPGPKNPDESGNSREIIRGLSGKIPVFGVCLGMQAINEVFGGQTVHAPEPVHGKTSLMFHKGTDLFEGVPSPFRAARYHSLAATGIPECLEVTAWTETGMPMALKHRSFPVYGVQFHPESFLTDFGYEMMRNLFSILSPRTLGGGFTHQTIELQDLRDHSIVDVFGRLADKPMTSILVSGGSHDCARFSILGYDPFCVLRSKGRETRLTRNGSTETITGDPLAVLESVLNQNRVAAANPSLPITAGGIGYFGYEMKNLLEKLPQTARDDLDLPDIHFCFYRSLLIHDGKYNTWQLCTFTPPGERDDHESRVRDLLAACSGPAPKRQKGGSSGRSSVQSNFTKQEYLDTVEKIRQYIINGHIYQANLSQRFSAPFTGDPYLSFTQLFGMNPAPFYAYLDCGDFKVVSTSPERFLFRKGAFVETRPIKGTRPRGKTAPDDESLKKELLESAKDEAELSMIVDLMRNDLSKVCCGESVRVAEHKRIEGYTNVFHLVSVVQGRLRDDLSPLDPIRACFPGGSITGCPKIRAMEIIDELEPNARGVYTGSIGYISFHDSMDLNIAIRTSVVKNGTIYFNVGGAVVYDSDPEEEYLETLYKGESIIKNLQASHES